MGLDVYLYTREQHEQNERHNAEWEALYERKESGEITQEQYDELNKEIVGYAGSEDVASERYPKHLFNRRYLRSSYNGGGFNRAVPDFIGDPEASLYGIFRPLVGDDSEPDLGVLTQEHIPALRESRDRALAVAERLASSDRLRVVTVSANQLSGTEFLQIDSDKALAMARDEFARLGDKSDDGWWSGRGMEWFAGTLKLIAAIPGGEKMYFRDDLWPAIHLIYRAEGEGFDSYVQSAEITAEFCDEACALIERDGSCYMSWSG